jgi:hypothetical protein
MQTQSHSSKPAAWVPPFAMYDSQLQKVLLIRAWRYTNGPRRLPIPDLATINREEINQAATAKALRGYTIRPDAPAIQHQAHAMHLESVRRAGGFLQLQAAIAFRAWRLGMDSVGVAETVGSTPQAVRVALWRFRDIAKRLGFEVGRAGHTAGTIRSAKMKQLKPRKPTIKERIISLHKDGVSIPEIASQVGWQKYQTQLRGVLRSAGYPIPRLHREPLLLDAEQVIALCRGGLTPPKIEAALGRKAGTIQKRIRKILWDAGVTRPRVIQPKVIKIRTRKKYKRQFDSPRAESLYRAGWRVVDIAVALGYQRGHGQNSVRRYLRMAGVYK